MEMNDVGRMISPKAIYRYGDVLALIEPLSSGLATRTASGLPLCSSALPPLNSNAHFTIGRHQAAELVAS